MRQKYDNFEPITTAAIGGGGGGGYSIGISPAALAVSIPSSNDLADLTGAYKSPLPNDLPMVFKHQFSGEKAVLLSFSNRRWYSDQGLFICHEFIVYRCISSGGGDQPPWLILINKRGEECLFLVRAVLRCFFST